MERSSRSSPATAGLLEDGEPQRGAHHGPDDVRMEYWRPILAHGRARGELRAELTDEQIVHWLGVVQMLFLENLELYPDLAAVVEHVDGFVVPSLMACPTPRAPGPPAALTDDNEPDRAVSGDARAHRSFAAARSAASGPASWRSSSRPSMIAIAASASVRRRAGVPWMNSAGPGDPGFDQPRERGSR